jgi:hypothetical protein
VTYEDQAEADFMSKIYASRSGQLENTTFAILSPDGKEKLTATGRGPFHEYRDNRSMARGMDEIAEKFDVAEDVLGTNVALPLLKSVDVALNVAASDGTPLVVTVAKDQAQLDEINQRLLPVAWGSDLIGQYAFASATEFQDLKPIPGVEKDAGVIVIKPGQFGLSGKVLAQFPADVDLESLGEKMKELATSYESNQMSHDAHVQLGIQLGIDWTSEIPETDQQSLRAKERARRK